MLDMKDKLEILYEDNHIIVVIKPINVLSQSDNTKDLDMLTMVKNYVKEKYNKPGNVYIGLVHRLDRPTGGIMVFARTSKAAKRLSEEIKNNNFNKSYLAVIPNLKEKEGTLINYIVKDSNGNSLISDKEHGKYAELSYDTLSTIDDLSLVKINLVTGRHHQIRVQFKNIDSPLYGDQRYGILDKKQLCLFAYHLEFIHPVTKEKLSFTKYPDYSKFNLFKECFK